MKKKNAASRNGVLEMLQIPPDLSRRDCILTLCGCGELYVENYRRILEYREEKIRILTKNGILAVGGKRLIIASYTGEEMYVTGVIREITLDSSFMEG